MKFLKSTLLIFYISNISCAQKNTPPIETPEKIKYTYETVIEDIDVPWGLDFINAEEFLLTEKSGKLYKISNNLKTEITGLPDVYVRGQGGLLDVALHPNFKQNNIIFLTLSSKIGDNNGGNTALYSAELNNKTLVNLKLLYKATPDSDQYRHYGGKILLDDKNDYQLNKFFYKQIGLDHYWRDRLLWSDKEWIKYVTNKNLETEIANGNFREDLYFRLNVITIEVPKLSERPGDIEPLTQFFTDKYSKANGLGTLTVSSNALSQLKSYHWPGNVGELENTIHRGVLLAADGEKEHYSLLSTRSTRKPFRAAPRALTPPPNPPG